MKTIEWGFLIVKYLLLGGLSAAYFSFRLATFLYKIDEPSPYTRIARLGACALARDDRLWFADFRSWTMVHFTSSSWACLVTEFSEFVESLPNFRMPPAKLIDCLGE